MAGTTYTGFAAADAVRLLGGGRPGVSQIRVAAEPGVSEDELAARVTEVAARPAPKPSPAPP